MRALIVAAVVAVSAPAVAQDDEDELEAATSAEYHTPLAGEPLNLTLWGRRIEIPWRDRTSTLALNLGSTFFVPPIGGESATPFAALYWEHQWTERRVRAVLSGLVNDVDYAERLGGPFEALLHVDNSTIPFAIAEVVDGKSFKPSALYWGEASGWPGIGFRIPVAPYQTDNWLRVELLYKVGWLYTRRAHDTDSSYVLPRDTVEHGPVLRLRVDELRRNLLELPHVGWAMGAQASFSRRDRWGDEGIPDVYFLRRDATRDLAKVEGYAVAAVGLPLLSEKHRLVVHAHAGAPLYGTPDRFSAFRLGGGPPTTETNDFFRSPYPGATFDQFAARWYAGGALEYRYEVLFFLYLHVRGTAGIGRIATREPDGSIGFATRRGGSFSCAVTSGFLWESEVYIEWAYDLGASRGGHEGSSILVLWSKSL
jgi:hypothetical protein